VAGRVTRSASATASPAGSLVQGAKRVFHALKDAQIAYYIYVSSKVAGVIETGLQKARPKIMGEEQKEDQ
jgi:hypothetical protein